MLIDIPNSGKARVVVIGGGFGGIRLAKALSKKNVQVVLIDKNNYHAFQPLLYQVATAGLEADSIAYPIRKIFGKSKNVFFRMGEVQRIIPEEKKIEIDNDHLFYDYLVIATGAKTNYFGNEGLTISSMPMKSVPEALDLRSMILQNFEKILTITNERKKQSYMNFVIAGAGPTGVELAGALGELKKHVFPRDYPELDLGKMNIYLVQSGDRVLPMLSEKSSLKAKRYLEELGVQVVLNTRVLDYNGDYVQTNTGNDLIARTLIWTAGVTGNPIDGLDPKLITKTGRYLVDEYNRVQGYSDVFAIGDVACMITKEFENGHPQVAPAAIQQATHFAKNILLQINKKTMKPFKYKDKGSMATIGKNRAVVEVGNFKIGGAIAWMMWMFVHLMSLVGFRNRFMTFINWTKNYFSSDRGMRLIIREFDLTEVKRRRKREMEAEKSK
ncbi:MAG TPA: NAD(P)/FAD-dependent oxidoreductase [Flavobacteriales bacterium]|nr:NAD(P)/FAD-dependent oxidoreductase [Flavobacteriales bacterium]